MKNDDFFKKRRSGSKERKREIRTPRPNSFLIVSEGSKTEPQYFEGLAEYINIRYGQGVSVEKPMIDARGEGKGTVKLVEAASKFANHARIVYSQKWVVFDKDDFSDFDEAVALAKQDDFRVAWSNSSFEYWLYLHFNYSEAALHRDEWEQKLDELFKKRKTDPQGYRKSDQEIFDKVTAGGNLKRAVQNSARIERLHRERGKNKMPSQCDPCTTVHHLIKELEPWLDGLL